MVPPPERIRAIVIQVIIADGIVEHALDHGRPVDPRYGSYETSDLTVEILPQETNRVDLTLDTDEIAASSL